MAKRYNIHGDTETSGLDPLSDQILTAGFVVEDDEGNVIEEIEYKILLKDGVVPSPKALQVNKINPFSKEWKKSAISESELVSKIQNLCKKYETEGTKPVLFAYNAAFDKGFFSVAMARNGVKFSDAFSKSVRDPIKNVKKLIDSGALKTRDNGYGKSSAALEAVASALGISYSGDGAHSALSDAKVSREVAHRTFEMSTGKKMKEMSVDPSVFQPGEVRRVTTDSASSGLKQRSFLVLHNDADRSQLIALDEDDIKKNGGLRESSVRTFNYDTIVSEESQNVTSEVSLMAYYKTQGDSINQFLSDAIAKAKKTKSDDSIFDEDTKNFELIDGVSKKMVGAEDKSKALLENYNLLLNKFNGDRVSAKTVLTKAERLAQSRGYKGWSKDIFPESTVVILHGEDEEQNAKLKVALHPSGHYGISLSFEKNGEQFLVKQNAKNQKEAKKVIAEHLLSGSFDEFISELPDVKMFKDTKHPLAIEGEIKAGLEYAKSHPEDAVASGAMAGILSILKKDAPGIYSKYSIEGGDNNDEDFYSPVATHSDSAEKKTATAKKQLVENDNVVLDGDHLKKGEKPGKTPCALCGRPLSAALSAQHSMGPTCRERAGMIERDEIKLENVLGEMKPGNNIESDFSPGSIGAVKYVNFQGKDRTIFVEVVSIRENDIRVIDKKLSKELLDGGNDPVTSVYLATVKIPKDSIVGVAKIDPSKISKGAA